MDLHAAGHRRGGVCAPHHAAVEAGRAVLAVGTVSGTTRSAPRRLASQPEPSSFAVVPWEPTPTARLMCDVHLPGGAPFAADPRQALKAVLTEAKAGFENVVKTTVYMTDLGDFSRMNAVYERLLGNDPPARSTIQAAALPRGVRVEIDVIAVL